MTVQDSVFAQGLMEPQANRNPNRCFRPGTRRIPCGCWADGILVELGLCGEYPGGQQLGFRKAQAFLSNPRSTNT